MDVASPPSRVVWIELPDEAATAALARRLAPLARRGDVLALWGGLGTGKTAFARAFVRAGGHLHEEVPSPTFTLVQTYEPTDPIAGLLYHFDLYRLKSPEEAYELGLEEALAHGVSLIEWPDRLGSLLPARRLDVTLTEGPTPDSRLARLDAYGDWLTRLREAGLA